MMRILVLSLLLFSSFVPIHCGSSKSRSHSGSKSKSTSSTSSSSSSSQCLPTLSDLSNDGSVFKFDSAQQPRDVELNFCKHYRSSTCCSPSDTTSIMRQVYPFYSDIESSSIIFSESCRSLSVAIMCAPCDPLIGTGSRHGICPDTCNSWYTSCSSDLFTTRDNIIVPCTDDSSVCYPLKTIVNSGPDMCRRMGFAVGSLSSTPTAPSSSLSSLIHTELDVAVQQAITTAKHTHDWSDVDLNSIRCFDPSLPGSNVPVNTGNPSPSSSSFKKTTKQTKPEPTTWDRYIKTMARMIRRFIKQISTHPMQMYGALFVGLLLSLTFSWWRSRRQPYDFSSYPSSRLSADELRVLRATRLQANASRNIRPSTATITEIE